MNKLNYFWQDLLDFIFRTKIGYIVFSVVIVAGIVGLLSIFFEVFDFEVLIGVTAGALFTITYLAIKDKTLKWL